MCSIITHTLRLNLFCFHFVVLSSFTFVAHSAHFLFYPVFFFFFSFFSFFILSDRWPIHLPCVHTQSACSQETCTNNWEGKSANFSSVEYLFNAQKPAVFSYVCIVIQCTHAHKEIDDRTIFTFSPSPSRLNSKLNRFISFFSLRKFVFASRSSFTENFLFISSIVRLALKRVSLPNKRKARCHSPAKRGLNYKLSYSFSLI